MLNKALPKNKYHLVEAAHNTYTRLYKRSMGVT